MQQTVDRSPKVTVNIPVYNGERYLRATVESILAQTFRDFELLIIDDASSDGTASILEEMAAQDSRIRVVRNERNLGSSAARNRGLDLARGEYIACHDQDDLSHPTRLGRGAAFLDSHPDYGMVGSWYIVIDHSGRTTARHKMACDHDSLVTELLKGNRFGHGSVMFRAAPNRRYDPGFEPADDHRLWVEIISQAKVAQLPEFLYSWREHGTSRSSRTKDLQLMNSHRVTREHLVNVLKTARHDRVLRAYLEGDMTPQRRQMLRTALLNLPEDRLRDCDSRGRCGHVLESVILADRFTLGKIPVCIRCAGFWPTFRWGNKLLPIVAAKACRNLLGRFARNRQ